MTPPSDLLPLPAGLVAIIGDEGAGKTTLLRQLAGDLPAPAALAHDLDALWLDLALPGRDGETAPQVWAQLHSRCPRWDAGLQQSLAAELGLVPHLDKTLSMLSTGSRRKVALVGLLAAGATVTCLDQPFAALDAASARVLREVLAEAANHPSRTWLVADYDADVRLAWRHRVVLG